MPEPMPFRPGADGALVSTLAWGWVENTRRLIARKRYALTDDDDAGGRP